MLLLSCVLEQVLLELDLNRVGVGPAHVHDLLDGQGTVGVLYQPPYVRKEAGAYDYIFGIIPVCNYALRCDYSCYSFHAQKIAPSLW